METEEERCVIETSDGEQIEIVKFQHWTEHRPANGPVRQIKGSHEWLTTGGNPVTEMTDGTFRLFDLGDDVVLRRVPE